MSLKNPAAVLATDKALEIGSKVQEKASKGISNIDSKTNNAMSWLMVVGGAGVVLYTLSFLNKLSRVQNAVGDSVSNTVSTIVDGFSSGNPNQLPDVSQLGPVTISPLQAQNKASLIFEAMDRPGTNFTTIKNALNNVTPADFVLIAHAFGAPRYNIVGEAPWPWPKLNLLRWLAAELSDNEKLELMQSHPLIFG